ncbi:MAG: phosphatidate cytidylyltransferase [Longimicrobiales bacterium]|nr:phosphatidate cytidylyltransferase [Longimicrobiales bacterium]
MSELGKRVAVAAVGIPLVLGLAYVGGWYLALPLAAFAAWGTHEVGRFAEERGVRPMDGIAASAAAALVVLASWHGTFIAFAPAALGVVGLAAAAALLGSLWRRGVEGTPLAASAVTVLSVLYVGLGLAFVPLLSALPVTARWSSTLSESGTGLAALTFPLAITWIADASAYFAGSAFGRTKLAPSVSPNKSWEGFWAALLGGAVAAAAWRFVVGALGLDVEAGGYWTFALVGAAVAVTGVVGDLVESLLKREAGVKDSGTFFPGHGGVMDRIDSLLFTIPSSYLAMVVLGVSR